MKSSEGVLDLANVGAIPFNRHHDIAVLQAYEWWVAWRAFQRGTGTEPLLERIGRAYGVEDCCRQHRPDITVPDEDTLVANDRNRASAERLSED